LENRTLLSAAWRGSLDGPAGLIAQAPPAVQANGNAAVVWEGAVHQAVAGQWIAGFAGITGTPAQQASAVQQELNGNLPADLHATVLNHLGVAGEVLIQISTAVPEARVQSLANLPNVSFVEPNSVEGTIAAVPDDPGFAMQYGFQNTGQVISGQTGIAGADISATQAWDITTGSYQVVVADLDTGIDYTHPDLRDNIWLNNAEIPDSRLANLRRYVSNPSNPDDTTKPITFADLNDPRNWGPFKIMPHNDGTGHMVVDANDVLANMDLDGGGHDLGTGGWSFPGNTKDGDTAHPNDYVGWNFVANNNRPLDDNNHGTHTGGTIGAEGNNGIGVTGVNWVAQIMPLKWLDGGGNGTPAQADMAIAYSVLHGARVSSNSWRFTSYTIDQSVYDAIQMAGAAGQLFVCAAGNESRNNDTSDLTPAAFTRTTSAGPALDNVIAVAATDNRDGIAGFSNYGAHSVQLGAPGVNVWSTFPATRGSYAFDSGTSMATPHVAGAATLLWGYSLNSTYLDIKNALLAGVDHIASLQGVTVTGGRLNVYHSLQLLNLTASAVTPPNGAFVEGAAPTSFVIDFSSPVVPDFAASVFTVNGTPADGVTLSSGNLRATFTFNTSPVTTQGLETERIAAGAILRASDSNPLAAFTASFRYAAVRLRVADTNPASGSTIDIPFSGTFTVDLNSPVDPASVANSNLTLSQGTVTEFTVAPNDMSITYTLSGVSQDGPLTVTIPDGAYRDAFGNPGAAFTGNYTLRYNHFPLTLTPINPLGSLIYDPAKAGTIAAAGQSDSFTVPLSAGHTLTLLARPTDAALQPAVQLFDPNNTLIASATAPAAGSPELLDTIPITLGGTYTIIITGASGSTGGYAVKVNLDTALEEAQFGGPPDTSRETAQNLEPAFVHLSPTDAAPQRAAVAGRTGQTTANYYATAVTPTFEDISATGTRTLVGVDDGNVSVGPSQLGGFTFTFYGHTYSTVYFSSNGLITFGNGDSTLSPSDLTTSPPEASIAVFLEDLYVIGASDSAVLWQVLGSGASQRLVIQWNDISFYRDSPRTGGLTFEAELFANGAIQLNYVMLSTSHVTDEGHGAAVGVKDAGTQGPNRLLLDNQGSPSTYSQFVGSHLSTLITQATPTSEFYAFHLNAGDSATLALTNLIPARTVTEDLQDSTGRTLAVGRTGPTNVSAVINNFVAPASGTYYVRIGGDSLTIYSLVVTRDADFATKPNTDFQHGQAQALLSATTAGGQTVLGYVAGSELSTYQVQAAVGGTLLIQTQTPLDDPAGPVGNPLVPIVYLYDPSGNLVATSSRSAPDGKNVLLSYPVPAGAGGYYFVQIGSADGSAGEYVLTVAGDTGVEPDFAVASTNPANHASVRTAPTQITVTFTDSLLLPSVSAAALTVDGQAATAFTLVNATTVAFTVPALSAGTHTVNLDSSIMDIHGRPVDAYQGDFSLDNIGPRIIGSSIQEGDVLSSSTIDYVVTFNKPLDPSHLNNADFLLHGTVRGTNLTPANFTYDPVASVLTLHYVNVPSDQYTLTLVSGPSNIVDLAGNPLDGAPHWPIDPAHPSGTGIPGSAGNFFVHFSDQSVTTAYPTTFTQLRPAGSLVYQGPAVTDRVVSGTDTPFYTLAVNAGETITVLVTTTTGTFRPAVTVFDAAMNVVGTGTASATGQPVVLQALPVAGDPETSQIYTIQVSGFGGSVGGFAIQVTLDAGLESRLYGGPSDTSRATAQDLTPLFAALPKGASEAAVLGQTLPTGGYSGAAITPTFEDVSATGTRTLVGVDDGFDSVGPSQLSGFTFPFYGTTYNTIYFSSNGLITFGVGDSSYSNTDLTSSPTEACIAVLWQDLVVTGASDSGVYWQVVGSGAAQHLVIQWQDVVLYGHTAVFTFEAVLNLDGSMQFNYGNLANASEGTGSTVGIKAAGPQGPNRLLLSYHGSGPQYIGTNKSTLITPIAPGSEYFALQLNAGQHVSLAVVALATGQVTEELQDSAGNVLASGTSFGGGIGQAINNFMAPAAGTYYVRVAGGPLVNYDLVVTRNAVLDLGGNGTQTTAQDMDGTAGALGYLATASSEEWYRFTAAGGQALSLATYTPGDGGGVFVNPLAPHIELYTADGTRVAVGVLGGDGHNEQINYTVPSGAGGTYYLRIVSANGQPGEFFLDPEEAPAAFPPIAALVPPPDAATPEVSDSAIWESSAGRTETVALDRVFAADASVWQQPNSRSLALGPTTAADSRGHHGEYAVYAPTDLGEDAEDLPGTTQ
jgi:subtilisin family serine protease